MRAAVLMTAFMQDLRIMHPPVPVVTGACIALPLPGEASLVMLELEPRVLISFGYYLENAQGLPVADPEFLVYQAADGQGSRWPSPATWAAKPYMPPMRTAP